ncbi:helix-turn-helix domain-containing protein [Actinoplanes sp. NPDC051513]|uniref:helix-turn-helix domain-containing protein n=1 Tax=Actinoplanes sp. NPDC051513 TaxID=3363908 RepID=UPI0037964EAC
MATTCSADPAGVEINGTRVRQLRKLRGESIAQFAERCGITFGYLGHIERGRRDRVSPGTFARICDALDIPVHQRDSILTPAARQRMKAAA